MPEPSLRDVIVDGRRLELRVVGGEEPALVFLHEGLGSLGLWRGFDERVAAATRHATLAYSRAGHGRSGPADLPLSPDFMHHEALVVLPTMLEEMESRKAPILIGHSDGASIALIHAASQLVSGLVLLAPHVFVEPESIDAIEATRARFETTDLPARMARHHRDPVATFYGWNDIWLDPGFHGWNIEDRLPAIDCPTLLIQGVDDEYGTMAQVDAIEAGVSGPVRRLILEDCGHSPHLAQPERVLEAVTRFVMDDR
jgi:pimeloyl-ACP methyl ester carboxylesterase